MCEVPENTLIIFFPFDVNTIKRSCLCGDFVTFNNVIRIFFVNKIYDYTKNCICESLFEELNQNIIKNQNYMLENFIKLEVQNRMVTVKEIKENGQHIERNYYYIIWINYNFNEISKCEISFSELCSAFGKDSYFRCLGEKITKDIKKRKKIERVNRVSFFSNIVLQYIFAIVLYLATFSAKALPLIKYFNVGKHADNYLKGFAWAMKSIAKTKKLNVKVINFFLSVIMDMIFGILFFTWLHSKISLDSSSTLFLVTTESMINSIKELLNWLRGEPAGLKLNAAFNKILATFFSLQIDLWRAFLGFLKPGVKIIFQLFLMLGLFGITFQASIAADLLWVFSFHVCSIQAYASKLFSYQLSSLISLCRLFLGRKKNPLRGKIDSCTYSAEQLFVGTLGFTILLFLLPTTVVYYIVFTSIKLSILVAKALLMFVKCLSQNLPVYTTILWFLKSSKASTGIEIRPCDKISTSDFIIVQVEPVIGNWWETVKHFTPETAARLSEFNINSTLFTFFN